MKNVPQCAVRETWETRVTRWRFNWFPAYRGTGGRVECIDGSWTEVRIRLPLSWRTRNYVGTIYGGSLYGAIDPFYMIMLIKLLGREYEVWDKAATIRFRRPGRTTLHATFRIEAEVLERIRTDVERDGRSEPHFTIDLVDEAGEVHATCEKVISVRRRKA